MRLVILSPLVLLTACALYPTSHTYFKPNAEDGTPAPSQGCGYVRSNKDTLERKTGDLLIAITPRYKSGEDLRLTVYFQSKSNDVVISPEKFQLRVNESSDAYMPVTTKVALQEPRKGASHYAWWVDLTYPRNVDLTTEISVDIPADAIAIGSVPLKTLPFRFTKVKITDVYFGSINC